jgi:type IV pilus assembly protein PilO
MNYELLRDILRIRRNSFLFLGFLALLNLAAILYLALLQQPQLAKAHGEWLIQREAQASGQEVVGSAARYEQGMRDLGAFRERLIPKPAFAAFLKELFQIAGKHSVTLQNITYKPDRIEKQGIFAYGIAYTVSGSYGGIKGFLAELSRYHQMVTVDSVSLSSNKQTEEAVALKVQMTAYLETEGK